MNYSDDLQRVTVSRDEIGHALDEADKQVESTAVRYTHEDVFGLLRECLRDA